MNNQVGVRVRHRGEHIKKQTDSRLHIELVVVAVLVDVFAFNVLEDEIRLPVSGDAGVEKFGDVRVRPGGRGCCLRV